MVATRYRPEENSHNRHITTYKRALLTDLQGGTSTWTISRFYGQVNQICKYWHGRPFLAVLY